MALATTVVFSMIDDKGETSTTKVRVPSTFSISDYQEFALAFGQLILNTSNAQITGISISFGVDLTSAGLKTIVGGVSSVGKKMKGLFATASGTIAKWLLPAPYETKVVNGTDEMDLTDTAVAALNTGVTGGITVTGGTMEMTNKRGHVVSSLNSLTESFRKRSAG